MAGDWIKMRGNLWDDPRVAKICDLTDCSEAQIIGGLYWLWATADQHTENGIMPGLTLRQIDRKTGIQGFGSALCDVGWLADHPEGVRIVKFEEHNGQSAKRRCSEAQRKANSRNVSASDADNERTESGQGAELEKEKRREEKKDSIAVKPKKSNKTPLPSDFVISDRVRSWAAEKGHSRLEAHFENFISAAKRNGYTYADWDEAFMEAIRKDWAKLGSSQVQHIDDWRNDPRFKGAK